MCAEGPRAEIMYVHGSRAETMYDNSSRAETMCAEGPRAALGLRTRPRTNTAFVMSWPTVLCRKSRMLSPDGAIFIANAFASHLAAQGPLSSRESTMDERAWAPSRVIRDRQDDDILITLKSKWHAIMRHRKRGRRKAGQRQCKDNEWIGRLFSHSSVCCSLLRCHFCLSHSQES